MGFFPTGPQPGGSQRYTSGALVQRKSTTLTNGSNKWVSSTTYISTGNIVTISPVFNSAPIGLRFYSAGAGTDDGTGVGHLRIRRTIGSDVVDLDVCARISTNLVGSFPISVEFDDILPSDSGGKLVSYELFFNRASGAGNVYWSIGADVGYTKADASEFAV